MKEKNNILLFKFTSLYKRIKKTIPIKALILVDLSNVSSIEIRNKNIKKNV